MTKLMCCADYFNGEPCWLPEYGEPSYYLDAEGFIIVGNTSDIPNLIAFKTMEAVEATREILKEDIDKLNIKS